MRLKMAKTILTLILIRLMNESAVNIYAWLFEMLKYRNQMIFLFIYFGHSASYGDILKFYNVIGVLIKFHPDYATTD